MGRGMGVQQAAGTCAGGEKQAGGGHLGRGGEMSWSCVRCASAGKPTQPIDWAGGAVLCVGRGSTSGHPVRLLLVGRRALKVRWYWW